MDRSKIPMTRPQRRQAKRLDGLTIGLVAAFLVVAIATSVVAFIVVRDMVVKWTSTPLDGVAINEPTPMSKDDILSTLPADPMQAPGAGPTPQPWDGASRVTLLVMGLDYRDWESGDPPRSDTMILLTVDPISKTAGMLSIPRDMWVNIPGFDYAKINTAYFLGETYKVPGGGPALAAETVQNFLGVPVNYYAQVDFGAFVKFINEIDGVKLNIKEEITIDPIGKDNKITLKPGKYTVGGETALAYARYRYTEGGDFDRAERQQEVIMAIRDKVLSVNTLPTLIAKAPVLYQEIASGIRTNLSMQDVVKLAWLGQQINKKNIRRGVIGTDAVQFAKSPDGLDILIPVPDKIRMVRDQIFTTGGPVGPIAAEQLQPTQAPDQPTPAPEVKNTQAAEVTMDMVRQEQARISLQNGSQTEGIATKTGEYLKSQGLVIAEQVNADRTYDGTTIIIYNGKPYTISYLCKLMNVNQARILNKFDPNSPVDIAVILGADWANKNPLQ
jgi:LCP family protein required for cell wall assembly